MKQVFFYVEMFCCFFSAVLSAKVIEISSIKELPAFIEKEMLVIWDIDNTILEPIQLLGSDQWFDHRMREYQTMMSKKEAFEKTYKEWVAIECLTKVKTVEPETVALINQLQQEGVTMMALTARGDDLCFCTLNQFQSLNIDLSLTSPSHGEFFFLSPLPLHYRKGILFSNGTHAGEALIKFLKKIHYLPKSVLCLNDKKSRLREIEETLGKQSIPFLGLRYGFLDEKVAHFDSNLAQIEWDHFGQLLPDPEAQEKLLLQKR